MCGCMNVKNSCLLVLFVQSQYHHLQQKLTANTAFFFILRLKLSREVICVNRAHYNLFQQMRHLLIILTNLIFSHHNFRSSCYFKVNPDKNKSTVTVTLPPSNIFCYLLTVHKSERQLFQRQI